MVDGAVEEDDAGVVESLEGAVLRELEIVQQPRVGIRHFCPVCGDPSGARVPDEFASRIEQLDGE
jgi:hypothetical protein